METTLSLLVAGCTFLAAASPFILIIIRGAIKYQRQEIITDLARVFDIENKTDTQLIPSFEFVKYKYFVGHQRHRLFDVMRKNESNFISNLQASSRYRQDFAIRYWLTSCSPFSFLAGFATFIFANFMIVTLLGYDSRFAKSFSDYIDISTLKSVDATWILALCAAFCASFITAMRNLYRAVKNFDLSPGTIVSETIKILLSIVLAPIITIIWTRLVGEPLHHLFPSNFEEHPGFVTAGIIATAFVAGVMPDVALRKVVERDYIKNYKQEEEGVYKSFKITPLEIIDGIDSEIRFRLNDHHIHSPQNLAAANPLMLFVETPFGVYQIMDWVAQAQLCCSVGREKLIQLWSFGIRTLFDLERLARSDDKAAEALLIEIGRILLNPALVSDGGLDKAAAAELVRSSIELRLDDPHVQRLRQIYIAVCHRLGDGSRRFIKMPC